MDYEGTDVMGSWYWSQFWFSISNTIPSPAPGRLIWLYSKHPPLTPGLPAHGGCFPHNSLWNISSSAFHEQRGRRLCLPQKSRRSDVVTSCRVILLDRMKAAILATFTNLWKNSPEDWRPWPHAKVQTLQRDVCCSLWVLYLWPEAVKDAKKYSNLIIIILFLSFCRLGLQSLPATN